MCASTMADHADKQALLKAFKMRMRLNSYANCGSGKHMGKAKADSLDPGKVVHEREREKRFTPCDALVGTEWANKMASSLKTDTNMYRP